MCERDKDTQREKDAKTDGQTDRQTHSQGHSARGRGEVGDEEKGVKRGDSERRHEGRFGEKGRERPERREGLGAGESRPGPLPRLGQARSAPWPLPSHG